MDRRTFLAVAISMAILFGWSLWIQPRYFPEPKPPVPPTAPAASPEAVAQTPGTPAASPQPGAPVKEKAAAVSVSKKTDLYSADFSSWGAAPSRWQLLDKQYREKVNGELTAIDLVRTQSPNLPLTVTFPESSFNVPADAAWTQLPGNPDELIFAYDDGTVHVEKRYTFVPDTYQLKLKVIVENRGTQPVAEHTQVSVFGKQDPNVKSGGMFAPRVAQTEGVCNLNGKLKRGDLHALLKERVDETGLVRWVGIDEKYFVVAAALNPGNDPHTCSVSATGEGVVTASVMTPERKIAAGQKAELELAAFLGPKLLNKLDDVKVGGVDARLGDAINYGWTEAIARPMLAVLKGIHFVVPNWGLAIIALTIMLKIVTWWPTTKSMKSMKSMAKLKPEMDRLKEKYGDDKNRMNQEVMELYKKHGINPLGGCLPMLIQMPIYIALYSMLGNSVELYRSGFVGWIHDLTAPDPYFVLPLLTGALMFAQQKLSPAPPDPQQKMMGYMMPVMFTAISLFLPSGLTVYILTNTLLTMLQQWWMNRHEPKPAKVTGKPARA
jgi:YidC/Oxa1 family membrane protein insertase